jgi:hypothetical protein
MDGRLDGPFFLLGIEPRYHGVQPIAIPTYLSWVPFELLIRKENVADVRKRSETL